MGDIMACSDLTCCVDWVSFTFPIDYTVDDAIRFCGFNFEDIVMLKGGASGYTRKCKHVNYNIWFLFDGNVNMGVHVDCSGSAVQYLITSVLTCVDTPFGDGHLVDDFAKSELVNFFIKMTNVVKFTRIDLAIDDMTGKYYSLQELHEIGEDRNYIALFKQWREVFTKDTSDGHCLGYTIYMGSRDSDTFIRVYDKKLEQEHKNISVLYSSWVRWEMEIKHNNADILAKKICDYIEIKELVFDLLNRYIRVIDLASNSRKCRCKNTEKWDSFIGAVHRIRLKRNDADIDIIERKRKWLHDAVSKSLSMCIASDGGDTGLIYDMLEYGRKKYNNSDMQIIKEKMMM